MNHPCARPVPLLTLLAVAVLGGAAMPAAAAFRCGSQLIEEGDPSDKVRELCGPPTTLQHKTIHRPTAWWHNGRPFVLPGVDDTVQVEIWTYNLGSSQLIRRIRFEDGLATELATLGYGYP
jgi:hypothetical protein